MKKSDIKSYINIAKNIISLLIASNQEIKSPLTI